MTRLFIIFLLLLSSLGFDYIPRSLPQTNDNQIVGLPVIRNYSPSEYNATPQNWSIVKDKRGVMYFANTGGVLEFDGVEWRLIPVTNEVARNLAIDKNGIIYVGGVDEFGYLEPDSAGLLKYISLIKELPLEERKFGDIWSVHVSDRGIFFQSTSHLFLIKDAVSSPGTETKPEIKIWHPETIFSPAFFVNGNYYIPESEKGILVLKGDSLTVVPGSEQFAKETIYDMLNYITDDKNESEQKRILIGTANDGFYLYDGSNFNRFKTEADDFIKKNPLYFRGGILNNRTYAFGTQTGGMIVMNSKGRLLQIINKNNGLSDNTVWFVYPDDNGTLWLGLNNGIARVSYPSPLTLIDSRFGIDGLIFYVNQFKGNLYLSTPNGVYYSDSKDGSLTSRFKLVDGINSESWELLNLDRYQLAATTHGVYRIDDSHAEKINTNWRFAYSFCRSRSHPDIIYIGLHDGLAKLILKNGEWTDGGRIPGVNEIITQIVEDIDGTLWLSSYNKGIIRIIPDYSGNNSSYTISRFEDRVSGRHLPVVVYKNRVIFGTRKGLMNFDQQSNTFVYDSRFDDHFKDFNVTDLKLDAAGSLWIAGSKNNAAETVRIIPDNGGFKRESFPLLKIIMDNLSSFSPYKLFPDRKDKSLLWIAYGASLYRFDINVAQSHLPPDDYYTLIRKVSLNGDSTIYSGGLPSDLLNTREFDFSVGINSIAVDYSSSSYFHEESNKYQFMLEGYDDEWSDWISGTRKEYTNLSPGIYTFNVRAKNVLGEISKPASFTFNIASPWYRSVWAITLFSLLLISGIWWIVNLRFRILEKRNIELEEIVNKRTNEVRRQKDILEEQAQKLLELDRLKTNFFANISHEFRTPLTLIMGQIESVLGAKPEEFTRRKLKTALSNSKQLQALINRLLELTKLESGEFRMKVIRTELNSFLRKILSAFESLTEKHNITLRFNRYKDDIYIYLDKEKAEEVFNNLISNAIKFTPENGNISLTITKDKDDADYVVVYVTDTGVGIKEEDLNHIFDRFYQADGSQTREYEGTGIGLAIVKELVQLHKGIISAASTPGKGTEFSIRLRLGKDHLVNEPNVDFIESEQVDHSPGQVEEETYSAEEYYSETDAEEDSAKEVVLIVEDNHDMRGYIRENLEGDYRVIQAKNGEEGINKALEFIPDLVITDVMMPAVNGFELTEILKSDNKSSHIPIIMLTAKADEESKLKGLEKGVDDYLIKPFSTKELNARVGNLIKLRRLLKERYNEISAINTSEIDAKPIDKEFIDKVFKIIKDHLEDPAFSVTILAGEVGMSVSQLNRKLNALINQSAGKLIRSTKLDYASQLLKNKAGNVSEIAYRVGFSDLSSFTNSFKEKFGIPPSELLKSNKKPT